MGELANMLSWGFATEGVSMCAGASVAKADNEKVKGGLKVNEGKQKASKGTTVMHARELTVDQPSRS